MKDKKNAKTGKIEGLECELRFIREVKSNRYGEIIGGPHIIDSRMDEPTIYPSDEEETILYSFCN